MDETQVWGDIRSQLQVSLGWKVQMPDLSNSDHEAFKSLEGMLRRCVSSLSKDDRLQVVSYTGTDFGAALDQYDSVPASGTCLEVRQEISRYFRGRIECQTLIQSNVRFYISSSFSTTPKAFEHVWGVKKNAFLQRESYLDSSIRSLGGSITRLRNTEAYHELLRFFSPGTAPVDPDFSLDIDSLCRFCDVAPWEGNLVLDGRHIGVLVFQDLPRETWPYTMNSFFSLCIPGIRITVNIWPLDSGEEVRKDLAEEAKLARNTSLTARLGAEDKEKAARGMRQANLHPFRCQVICMASDQSTEGLTTKMEALRVALDETGARGYRPANSTGCLNFWKSSVPGWGPWNPYPDYKHRVFDNTLSHILPVRGTPEGDLDNPDWLVCGNENNLVGGKLFTGSQPIDLVVMGTKGSGKSATTQSLMLQCAHMFGFTAVIDDGFSWIDTCHEIDPSCDPIVVRSNGRLTFNPFDTRGVALPPQHLRSCTALIHLICGKSVDPDRNQDRSDLIAGVIRSLYERFYSYWERKFPSEAHEASVGACMAMRVAASDFSDAVQRLREMPKEQGQELRSQVTESEIEQVSLDLGLRHFLVEYAVSTWEPCQFPTLLHLWDELNTRKISDPRNGALYEVLAKRCERWLAGGEYGPILDGVSNVEISDKRKVIHFELGEMGKSEEELKSVVGFLITNEMRNVVQGMPRGIRKAVVIEELTAFLRVPNADQILIDYSERMRKYSCWLCYVFQQYTSLLKADPRVAEAILGNSLSLMLLRNNNDEELETLGTRIKIPKPVRDAIRAFPMPESMRGHPEQYAGFAYLVRTGKPKWTICRNMISKRVEEITSSSGTDFERKKERLNAQIYQAA